MNKILLCSTILFISYASFASDELPSRSMTVMVRSDWSGPIIQIYDAAKEGVTITAAPFTEQAAAKALEIGKNGGRQQCDVKYSQFALGTGEGKQSAQIFSILNCVQK